MARGKSKHTVQRGSRRIHSKGQVRGRTEVHRMFPALPIQVSKPRRGANAGHKSIACSGVCRFCGSRPAVRTVRRLKVDGRAKVRGLPAGLRQVRVPYCGIC